MKIEEIKINDVVFAHNEELRTIYPIVVKEITQIYDDYYIGGYDTNDIKITPVSSDYVFSTKEEAINSYLNQINKEIIKIITSI